LCQKTKLLKWVVLQPGPTHSMYNMHYFIFWGPQRIEIGNILLKKNLGNIFQIYFKHNFFPSNFPLFFGGGEHWTFFYLKKNFPKFSKWEKKFWGGRWEIFDELRQTWVQFYFNVLIYKCFLSPLNILFEF
jgi:hypothetical protein